MRGNEGRTAFGHQPAHVPAGRRIGRRGDGKIRSDDADKAFPVLAEAMAKFCDVDGEGGRSVFPRAHDLFFRAAEAARARAGSGSRPAAG
ncbi:hypothetical protein C5O80_09165 [Burkholderia sp. SRS-46]|nr:hypothetical protein C5O80_09165 [Burkholderia sp. SRS-46]